MAEPSERVEGEEILDEYEDGDMEVARDDGSDHGWDGDAESGGGGETESDRACDLHPFLCNLEAKGAYFARWLN